jgi:two-component system phosphate regulon response regulator PhoB
VLPDLVVLDWMLPGQSGPGAGAAAGAPTRARASCRSSCSPRAPTRPTRSCGLDAGADDYLTKPFSTGRAAGAHPRVLRRKRAGGAGRRWSRWPGCGSTRPRAASARRVGEQRRAALGPTEFRLLHFLMTHPERVHSRAQLLDRVWGDHVFIEERTVDVHIKRLREALAPAQLRTDRDRARGRLPPHRRARRLSRLNGVARAQGGRRMNFHGGWPGAWPRCAGPGAGPAGGWMRAGWPLGRGRRTLGWAGCGGWPRWPCTTGAAGGCCAGCGGDQGRCRRARRPVGRAGLPHAPACLRLRERAGRRARRSAVTSSCRRSRPRPTACCCSTPRPHRWCNPTSRRALRPRPQRDLAQR